MSEYHLYVLNENGRIFTREDLVCSDDEQAINIAQRFEAPNDVELWRGKEIVWSGKPNSIIG